MLFWVQENASYDFRKGNNSSQIGVIRFCSLNVSATLIFNLKLETDETVLVRTNIPRAETICENRTLFQNICLNFLVGCPREVHVDMWLLRRGEEIFCSIFFIVVICSNTDLKNICFFLREELLSGMTKLDEQLDTYLASLKQLKSLDLSTDELKDQQETLQAAISNSQHPLHTVQAK